MENQDIIKILKDYGELPGYRVAGILGTGFYKALIALQRMEREGEVISEVRNNKTYWAINNKEKADEKEPAINN
jgi:hypothetical protein